MYLERYKGKHLITHLGLTVRKLHKANSNAIVHEI